MDAMLLLGLPIKSLLGNANLFFRYVNAATYPADLTNLKLIESFSRIQTREEMMHLLFLDEGSSMVCFVFVYSAIQEGIRVFS